MLEYFTVTHPFHPRAGQRLKILNKRSNFKREHAYYHDEEGKLKAILLEWTDLVLEDPYITVSCGRSYFRPDDLMTLADLIDGLKRQNKRKRIQKNA